jgi:hypothetical protein
MDQLSTTPFWKAYRPILLFSGTWAIINLLQAWWLPLDPDEAYYWTYAQRLDWGYFDHPPMVALLARIGIDWIPGSLGVRLGNIGIHIGTIFLFWKYLGQPQGSRFLTWAALCLGLPFLHLYGLVATPDGPLLFFTAWYLYLLQKFVHQPGWKRALLLGAVMAALLYSKYHGVLVILFSLGAHWRLWKDPRCWLACAFGALLFMPHLFWQYQHDFPSFRYHLKGRDDPYEWAFTWSYLINQVVLFSPLLFPLFIQALCAAKQQQRTATALILGFWGFFLYSTTKGHVEPQWTAVLSFPLALLAFEYSLGRSQYEKWLRRAGWATFTCIALARLALMLPIPGFKHPFQQKQWPKALEKIANGNPVVFQNSYRDASEYAFYTERQAFTFTDVFYRPSQFDLWDDERKLHGKRVLVLIQPGGTLCDICDTLTMNGKTRLALWADRLQVAQKVKIFAPETPDTFRIGQNYGFSLVLQNPYQYTIFPQTGNMPLHLDAVFLQQGQVIAFTALVVRNPPHSWPGLKDTRVGVSLTLPELKPGAYTLVFGIGNGVLPPGWNGAAQKITLLARARSKSTPGNIQ